MSDSFQDARIEVLENENAQLRQLLSECKEIFEEDCSLVVDIQLTIEDLLTRINEVLK